MSHHEFSIDHVAIPCADIALSVDWYIAEFNAVVLYSDETWAFLRIGQGKLALVTPGQHPPHVAMKVDSEVLATYAVKAGKAIDLHRDGTTGLYIDDPDGNQVELICYPAEQTVYSNTTS